MKCAYAARFLQKQKKRKHMQCLQHLVWNVRPRKHSALIWDLCLIWLLPWGTCHQVLNNEAVSPQETYQRCRNMPQHDATSASGSVRLLKVFLCKKRDRHQLHWQSLTGSKNPSEFAQERDKWDSEQNSERSWHDDMMTWHDSLCPKFWVSFAVSSKTSGALQTAVCQRGQHVAGAGGYDIHRGVLAALTQLYGNAEPPGHDWHGQVSLRSATNILTQNTD